ncbi:ABC transporter ATP-binding protein [Halopseudomonas aestusnigri]|uniref:ABC transporter ATP-binding protein n=1 Tax=Halopseudomonas aestusnigri TaxID=857252 RepID=UPI002553BAA2|nr:ABC transporter ATP-binding protein [Halopseudomonas aestusnigri]MDL2198445.1 ABC transporter ATP-binding protein [Halopseudomonas aestusnigri]
MKSDLKRVWAILTPQERKKSGLMVVLVILMAFAETVGVVSIMPFLSVLTRPEVIHDVSVLQKLYAWIAPENERGFIVALGLGSVALVVGASLFKTFTLHSINRFTYLLRHGISARLLSRYLGQPYEFFLEHNPAELARNTLSEVDQLHGGLIKPLSQLVAQGAVVLAMVTLLFLYDPWVALGAAVVVAALYGAIYLLVRKRLLLTGRSRQSENGARFKACNEALGGIKDVKVTGAADAYLQRFYDASRGYSRHQANAETLSQSPLYIVEAVGYTGLICLSLFLMQRSDNIAQVLPVLGLYGFAAYRILPSAQVMYRGFAQLKFSSAALDVIFQHLSLPAPIQRRAEELLRPMHSISLEGVTFSYPSSRGRMVFEDFNLTISANTSVGIVGTSGVGKSTLMDLLLGLLQPQRGRVALDGVALNEANVARWQRSIGYVPQHIYLADLSIAENIAFGTPKMDIDMEAVRNAAQMAQIHEFITAELPFGYETRVGDRGVRLSGGQRQRLGIARALYRNPSVLFMDEATSALDSQTEQALNEAIRGLTGSRTIVVIAHKESSLQFCQRIIQL